jgi:hypothetical protein
MRGKDNVARAGKPPVKADKAPAKQYATPAPSKKAKAKAPPLGKKAPPAATLPLSSDEPHSTPITEDNVNPEEQASIVKPLKRKVDDEEPVLRHSPPGMTKPKPVLARAVAPSKRRKPPVPVLDDVFSVSADCATCS